MTVTRVGTKASQTNLAEPTSAGSTSIKIRRADGFTVGSKISVGTPTSQEVVTVTAVSGGGMRGATIDFTPALARAHIRDERVVSPGTGLDLAAPLQFNHSANLPFSDRGTGISFTPFTIYDHYSNDPVQALGHRCYPRQASFRLLCDRCRCPRRSRHDCRLSGNASA